MPTPSSPGRSHLRRTILALLLLNLVALGGPQSVLRARTPEPDTPIVALGDPPLAEVPPLDARAETASSAAMRVMLPVVLFGASTPPIEQHEWLVLVNRYREQAGVPPVTANDALSANCEAHARYMAENNHLTHHQEPNLPWASPAGDSCARRGNAWLGSAFSRPIWRVRDTIESWMASPGHRLWLLYPTTPSFGYGFYTSSNNRAGAALDVLSQAQFSADGAYTGWPIRYPAPGQQDTPAGRYAITLMWPYFGPSPSLSSTHLVTRAGLPIAHSATTALPVGHQGILITPEQALPPGTTIEVTVSGSYQGAPFTYAWTFSTRAPS